MLKKQLGTLLFLLLAILSFAQTGKITLAGTIEVNTGEVFPYRIELTESGGEIKGYSLTYSEPNETEAVIKGVLDRQKHTLTFKETAIVYSHGFHTKAFMCLIDARLEYVQGGNGNILKGAITSTEADRTACTGGTITFGNEAEIQNLFSYHEQYDTFISMKKKVKTTAEPKREPATIIPATLVTDKVTAGIEKMYNWQSDAVGIDIWDGGNVDGDRVTLLFNKDTMLTNYYLVKEKRHLNIRLPHNGINVITIIACNEGSDPPNTANLLLTDGVTQYSVLAYNPKGQKAVIKIKSVK